MAIGDPLPCVERASQAGEAARPRGRPPLTILHAGAAVARSSGEETVLTLAIVAVAALTALALALLLCGRCRMGQMGRTSRRNLARNTRCWTTRRTRMKTPSPPCRTRASDFHPDRSPNPVAVVGAGSFPRRRSEPLIEPGGVVRQPLDPVARFAIARHPVALVRVDQQLGRHAPFLQRGVPLLGLAERATVIVRLAARSGSASRHCRRARVARGPGSDRGLPRGGRRVRPRR